MATVLIVARMSFYAVQCSVMNSAGRHESVFQCSFPQVATPTTQRAVFEVRSNGGLAKVHPLTSTATAKITMIFRWSGRA